MKEGLTMSALVMKINKKGQYWTYLLWLICSLLMMSALSISAQAATLSAINVSDSATEAKLTLSFVNGKPDYNSFFLQSPERLVIDIRQTNKITGLPMKLKSGLIQVVRESKAPDAQHQRIVLELAQKSQFSTNVVKVGQEYQLIYTLKSKGASPISSAVVESKKTTLTDPKPLKMGATKSVSDSAAQPATTAAAVVPVKTSKLPKGHKQVVVAIDAGHGGQDPGAIGQNGLQEKKVTLSIARKLEARLQQDPMFRPVLTRNGDYFISVAGRSEVARKFGANMLVSVHADSAPNRSARGSSVWVLSNRRANNELGNWLEKSEKQSELLGGAGDALANGADPYLSQAVLDLQFGNSQRVGYEVAVDVITQLKRIGKVHKKTPEHASLGVLRSPDIPSILVETGFISNAEEEKLLNTSAYQDQVAAAIHAGLRAYFTRNPLQSAPNK